MRRFRTLVLLLLALAPGALAQPVEVGVRVEPSTGATETDLLRLIVDVAGTNASPEVDLPRMTNLRVIGGPSYSSRVDMLNDRFSASVSLIWSLRAEGPGPASIPPFEIKVGGQSYRSEPIEFEVAKATTAPPPDNRPSDPSSPDRVDSFIEARLDHDEVWLGQPVTLRVTLFTAERVHGLQWEDTPSFKTFWVEDEQVVAERERYRTDRGGRTYVAYPMQRKVLVPNTPGTFEIEPFVARLEVEESGRRRSFFARTRTVLRKTQALTLKVNDLPSVGRPDGFSGAVGTFEMRVDLDRSSADVDDAVALTVALEGRGFLKSVPSPDLDAPPDLKVFPPESSERTTITRGELKSRRQWEWVLVPLAAGELELPEVRFSYFDVESGTYRTLSERPATLVVRRGERLPDRTVSNGGGIRAQRRDLAFIKARRGPLAVGSPRLHERLWYRAAAVLPLIGVPALIVLGRMRSRLRQDRGLARSRRASRLARKRLKRAKRQIRGGAEGEFHEALSRAVVEFVADRFDRSSSGLTYDGLDELLASRGVTPELRGRVRSLLERCDFARYVPSSAAEGERVELLQQAEILLRELERAVPR